VPFDKICQIDAVRDSVSALGSSARRRESVLRQLGQRQTHVICSKPVMGTLAGCLVFRVTRFKGSFRVNGLAHAHQTGHPAQGNPPERRMLRAGQGA
jgi:hypothetical protein